MKNLIKSIELILILGFLVSCGEDKPEKNMEKWFNKVEGKVFQGKDGSTAAFVSGEFVINLFSDNPYSFTGVIGGALIADFTNAKGNTIYGHQGKDFVSFTYNGDTLIMNESIGKTEFKLNKELMNEYNKEYKELKVMIEELKREAEMEGEK